MPRRRWDVLIDLVRQNGWTVGAELGVLKGDTFKRLLIACPNLHMVGVDLWLTRYYNATRADRPAEIPPMSESLEQDYDRLRYWCLTEAPKRATLLRMSTREAADRFDGGSLNFVFIDADHRYKAVAADIDAWGSKVMPGGMLLGHDYNRAEFPGVVKAVHERFESVETFEDNVWGVKL